MKMNFKKRFFIVAFGIFTLAVVPALVTSCGSMKGMTDDDGKGDKDDKNGKDDD